MSEEFDGEVWDGFEDDISAQADEPEAAEADDGGAFAPPSEGNVTPLSVAQKLAQKAAEGDVGAGLDLLLSLPDSDLSKNTEAAIARARAARR